MAEEMAVSLMRETAMIWGTMHFSPETHLGNQDLEECRPQRTPAPNLGPLRESICPDL